MAAWRIRLVCWLLTWTVTIGSARTRPSPRAEQEVVFLTISIGNGCDYCVAAHSMIADKMSKVPPPVLAAIRDGSAIPDEKLAALSKFTAVMRSTRGLPSSADVRAFLSAGYHEPQILEIILAIAVKTLSNYSNHLFHTPVDDMFVGYAWPKKEFLDQHSAPVAAVADFD